MSEIMIKIDERATQRQTNKPKKKKKISTTKANKQREKRTRQGRNYDERMRAKWFCCAFKFGFVQLICKSSITFKLNLEFASSVIFKQRELYESKHVAVECRCIKIWDLLSFWYAPQS